MDASACKTLDPRVRRTRQLLHEALDRLLETKDFEAISIQDITDAATLNRATFYDHYPDKAALLSCHAALRFQTMLDARNVRFDGTCGGALDAIALGVCDYLAGMLVSECGRRKSLDPHLEGAVTNVTKRLILDGIRQHAPHVTTPEMIAATLSWAIYGAAKEWVNTTDRPPSEQAATTIASLVKPVLLTWLPHEDR